MDKDKDYIQAYQERENDINSNYELLKQQNYEALRNRQIQLENAKNNAFKYTQNELANRGLASTGYGSSMNASIYNNYMNAFQNEGAAVNNQNNALDIQKRNDLWENQKGLMEAQQGRMNELYTNISSSSSVDNLNTFMANNNFGTVKNGVFEWGAKPSGMSDYDWNILKYNYDETLNNLGGGNAKGQSTGFEQTNDTFKNANDLKSATYRSAEGKTGNIGGDYKEEVDFIANKAYNGELKEGEAFSIKNQQNQTIFLKFTGDGFQIVNKNEYEQSKNKHALTWYYGAHAFPKIKYE